ncbi:MAG: hypothetical protein BWK75_05685 [Candidatus Altiarchaeales archaeon A3]|nr:MAG: hypothetical protein BWK75_05685 [Candidatus Altiarchaeales archaeon A3]
MVLDEVSKIDEDNDEVGNFGNFTEVHTAIKKMYREISNIMSKENGIFDETDIERFMKLWDEYQVNETIFITNNKARQLLSNSLLIQAKQFSDELKEARAMNDDNSQKPENMIKNKLNIF